MPCKTQVFKSGLSGTDDHAPEFHCISEDPVVVTLSEDERNQLERAI
jgi:hypothetical protein